MALPREAIQEFKDLWLKEYGMSISDNVAEKIAIKFLNLMRSIYKQIPKNANLDNYLKLNDYEKSNK